MAQRQSPEVDYVSGATQSADAFYYAVVEALAQGEVSLAIRTEAVMGTLVTSTWCKLRGGCAPMERAFGWFHEIEARCTRFEAGAS